MTDWCRTFAAWRRAATGAQVEHAQRAALDHALLEMTAAGAVPIGPVRLSRTDQHDLWSPGPQIVVLAEIRGLVLRHPNPFPRFDLFPRTSRVLRALARRPKETRQ